MRGRRDGTPSPLARWAFPLRGAAGRSGDLPFGYWPFMVEIVLLGEIRACLLLVERRAAEHDVPGQAAVERLARSVRHGEVERRLRRPPTGDARDEERIARVLAGFLSGRPARRGSPGRGAAASRGHLDLPSATSLPGRDREPSAESASAPGPGSASLPSISPSGKAAHPGPGGRPSRRIKLCSGLEDVVDPPQGPEPRREMRVEVAMEDRVARSQVPVAAAIDHLQREGVAGRDRLAVEELALVAGRRAAATDERAGGERG